MRAPWFLPFLVLCSIPLPAAATVDLNGVFAAELSVFGTGCSATVTQVGTSLTVVTDCGSTVQIHDVGTIDPTTGIFHLDNTDTPPGSLVTDGQGAPDGYTFTSQSRTSEGIVINTTFATRCGNGILEGGEVCDDGNRNDKDCCTNSCQPVAAGSACKDDFNTCTTDVCDGAGACVHPPEPDSKPCVADLNFCVLDHCDGAGSCVVGTEFAPAGAGCLDDDNPCTSEECDGAGQCLHPPTAAGTACNSDLNPCTSDVCDGAGGCTHPAVPEGGSCNSDSNRCTVEHCDATGNCVSDHTRLLCSGCEHCDEVAGCVERPARVNGPECRFTTAKASLLLRTTSDPSKDLLSWVWGRDDNGPRNSDSYTFCLYSLDDALQNDSSGVLDRQIDLPSDHWKFRLGNSVYGEKTPLGRKSAAFGRSGRIKAKGDAVGGTAVPDLSGSPLGVQVEVHGTVGNCFATRFESHDVKSRSALGDKILLVK